MAILPSTTSSTLLYETSSYDLFLTSSFSSAIVRTLNANYSAPQYGLGNANTTYPASAFITDLVYLKNAKVPINEVAIRVSAASQLCGRAMLILSNRDLE